MQPVETKTFFYYRKYFKLTKKHWIDVLFQQIIIQNAF